MIVATRCMMLALGLALATTAHAQISLSTAVDLAAKNDPRVRAAQADLDKAKAGLAQTKDAYVPSLNISGGYGTSAGVPLSVPIVFQINSQSLLFNFSQKDNLRAAEAAVKSADLALKDAAARVAADTVLTYVELDNTQHRLLAIREESGYAKHLHQIVSDRFDAGQDTLLDLHNASLTNDKIQLSLLQTQQDVAVLQDKLARLIGLPGNFLDTISSSIPNLPDPRMFSETSFISFAVRSAFSDAKSKQEQAFGESRYRLRPQVAFGANYSRISTAHTSFTDYYPGFPGKSDNALSIGISVQIPLYDKLHEDKAKAAAADAAHSRAIAMDARNQFLEGRFKLQKNAELLYARLKIVSDERDIAGDQLEITLAQLTPGSGDSGGPQLSPKDEQNARIQVSAKSVDILNTQLSLDEAEINLLQQTNGLSDWLQQASKTPSAVTLQPVTP